MFKVNVDKINFNTFISPYEYVVVVVVLLV